MIAVPVIFTLLNLRSNEGERKSYKSFYTEISVIEKYKMSV